MNVNLAFADDVSFESSHITLHIKNKHSVASSWAPGPPSHVSFHNRRFSRAHLALG